MSHSLPKAITLTMIFEASALNRDEKLGGNMPSIKKLTRFGNRTYTYLSRVAIRHYLFETLYRLNGDDWKPADCIDTSGVVQFDLTKQNILTHAELDAFGYMYTISGEQSLTRKACIGITKAISLETWEGDTQFNANHDLARRCGANPNPVNKEEHHSYYKVSFTIDVEKLGKDEWLIDNYRFNLGILELSFSGKNQVINVTRAQNSSIFHTPNGSITILPLNNKKKAIFKLKDEPKCKRLCQILTVLKNGLIYHSSGECIGIVPKFIIASASKLPIPLFHPFVELGRFDSSVLDNSYLEGSQEKIYVYDPNKLVLTNTEGFCTNWKDFLNHIGLNCEC